jgi:hypothetical protein
LEKIMRTIIFAATAAILTVCNAAPSFAQSRTFADCWALAESRGATYGAQHRGFVARCMAGNKVANAPAKLTPTPALRTEARTFSSCWALAEKQGATPGGRHKTFVEECMAGKRG